MPSSPGSFAIVLRVSLLVAGALVPYGALAQDRCSGTFCDLYYGGPSPTEGQPAAKPAAPTPLTVPNSGMLGRLFSGGDTAPAAPGAPAPARPLIGVGGGGLAAIARGAPAERCTGTFCDLYYGGPPPEPAPQPATAAPSAREGQPDSPADPAADPAADPDAAPEPIRTRRAAEREEPQHCAAPAQDPWRCYR